MRYLILVLLIVVGCSLFADQHGYTVTFESSISPDVSHHELLVWSGLDSLSAPFIEDTYSANYPTYTPVILGKDSVVTYTLNAVADGKSYIQVAVCAVDSSGNKSTLTVSNILKSIDGTNPEKAKNLILNK